jgi:hypothetical protein
MVTWVWGRQHGVRPRHGEWRFEANSGAAPPSARWTGLAHGARRRAHRTVAAGEARMAQKEHAWISSMTATSITVVVGAISTVHEI